MPLSAMKVNLGENFAGLRLQAAQTLPAIIPMHAPTPFHEQGPFSSLTKHISEKRMGVLSEKRFGSPNVLRSSGVNRRCDDPAFR